MAEIREGKLIFKVATYNIAALYYCKNDPEVIGRDIAETGADIVGLQEVDMFARRSGERNMAEDIAAAAGYPYYRFVRAIDLQGGQYGTAILSKHPIEKMEVIGLDSTDENRAVGRFVINLLGERINYFNTHLTCVAAEGPLHIARVSEILRGYDSYLITGDFNTNNFELFNAFHGHRLTVNAENIFPRFAGIDNIIMTEDFEYSDSYPGPEDHSDHRMLVATITKEQR
jgi:endonuclease/exonuclease/phosphatase family metal-dependent hydrolase